MEIKGVGFKVSRRLIEGRSTSEQTEFPSSGNIAFRGSLSSTPKAKVWRSPEFFLPVSQKKEPSLVENLIADSIRPICELNEFVSSLFGQYSKQSNEQRSLDTIPLNEKVSTILTHYPAEGLELARLSGIFNEEPYRLAMYVKRMSLNPNSRLHYRGEFSPELTSGNTDHLHSGSLLQVLGISGEVFNEVCDSMEISKEIRYSLPKEKQAEVYKNVIKEQVKRFESQTLNNESISEKVEMPSLLKGELIRELGTRVYPSFLIAKAGESDKRINNLAFTHNIEDIEASGGEYARLDKSPEEQEEMIQRDQQYVAQQDPYLLVAAGPIITLQSSGQRSIDTHYEVVVPSSEIHKLTYPEFGTIE